MSEHWQMSEYDSWLTPPEYLVRLARFDRIAYDPCGSKDGVLVAASASFWPEEDGLKTDWLKRSKGGLIFSNPPYGEQLPPWLRCYEYWADQGAEIVALVPAYPGAPWFKSVWRAASAVHWWEGRLAFLDSKRIPIHGAPMYSASVYFGRRQHEFATAFSDAGETTFIRNGYGERIGEYGSRW